MNLVVSDPAKSMKMYRDIGFKIEQRMGSKDSFEVVDDKGRDLIHVLGVKHHMLKERILAGKVRHLGFYAGDFKKFTENLSKKKIEYDDMGPIPDVDIYQIRISKYVPITGAILEFDFTGKDRPSHDLSRSVKDRVSIESILLSSGITLPE